MTFQVVPAELKISGSNRTPEKVVLFSWFYYMATIVRALWLAAEGAIFPCNDQAGVLKFFSGLDEKLLGKRKGRKQNDKKKHTKYNYLFNK